MKDSLLLLGKGAAMGAANVIPGVSGGTVAFITGIYQRLIDCLKSFDSTAIKLLLKGKFREFARHTDLLFLILLAVGAILSVLTLARLLKIGFAEHPELVWAFFFGLILTSVPAVGKQVRKWNAPVIVAAVIGCAIAVSMAFLPQADENPAFFYLMLCGVVAVCSMIIPGLSGSFVLLLMGNYQLVMIDSVNNLSGSPAEAIKVLTPVAVGAVVGLVVLSRVLSWLFKTHHDMAVALITGFVAGSLIIIWPWKAAEVTVFEESVAEADAGAEPELKEKTIGFRDWQLPKLAGDAVEVEATAPVAGTTFIRQPHQNPSANWMALGFLVLGAVLVWLLERSSSSPRNEDEPSPLASS